MDFSHHSARFCRLVHNAQAHQRFGRRTTTSALLPQKSLSLLHRTFGLQKSQDGVVAVVLVVVSPVVFVLAAMAKLY